MNKLNREEFLRYLKEGTEDREIKISVLNYFVNNYPVEIDVKHPFFGNTIGKTWTKLEGYKVDSDPLAMNKLDENYQKLINRLVEIENFK